MPNRLIKESICTSDTIDKLSWFEEVTFYRLIVNCDDYGRFDARPAVLKSRLYPLKSAVTDKSVAEAINRLATVGLVTLYECDGRPILQLPTWDKHQQVRAKKSKYPAQVETCNHMISDDIRCARNPIQSESNPNPNPNPTAVYGMQQPQPDPLDFSAEAKEACAYFEHACRAVANPPLLEGVEKYVLGGMELDVIKKAMDEAALAGKPTGKYVLGILRAWFAEGVKTLTQLDARRDKRAGKAQDTPEEDSGEYAAAIRQYLDRKRGGAHE